jgi:hypothetical protein
MFGSIVALPFVALVWIIKLPFAIVASGASAIGSVGIAIIKLPIAAVGAVWWAIVAVFGVLLRIPFRSIAKMLILSVALVWRIVASVFIMLGRVLSNPLGLALSIVILIVVLAAVYPEFSLGLTLALLILTAGAFWLSKLPSPFRIARNLALGEPITRVPPVLNTQDLDEIYALTPREFEWFVRDILTDLGYRNLSVVGGAGDLGVDIVGQDPIGRSCVVQCKRYLPKNRVGSLTVQHFLVMKNYHHKVERGLIVTTSGFTQPAIEVARANDIELVDGSDIVRMLGRRAVSRSR